jgi:hypothetical protein
MEAIVLVCLNLTLSNRRTSRRSQTYISSPVVLLNTVSLLYQDRPYLAKFFHVLAGLEIVLCGCWFFLIYNKVDFVGACLVKRVTDEAFYLL